MKKAIILLLIIILAQSGIAFAGNFVKVHYNESISSADNYVNRSLISTDNYGDEIMFLANSTYLKLTNKSGNRTYMTFTPETYGHNVSFEIVDTYTDDAHFWCITAKVPKLEYTRGGYIALDFWMIGQNESGNFICYVNKNSLANMGVHLPSQYGIVTCKGSSNETLEFSIFDNAAKPSYPLYFRWNPEAQWVSISTI